jgi:hypothetical protein
MDLNEAAARIVELHGEFRVPTLLRRVDRLCRGYPHILESELVKNDRQNRRECSVNPFDSLVLASTINGQSRSVSKSGATAISCRSYSKAWCSLSFDRQCFLGEMPKVKM